ncbi:hypothetical protein BFM12_08510 [Campylobacter jejuni]|nr:hypothetical protein [Campylobacter jejuni]EAL7061384.1 hypothetical protein [Campylobacter jejuni]EHR9968503.1 hypothetical protein [Campylobacter jejuni]
MRLSKLSLIAASLLSNVFNAKTTYFNGLKELDFRNKPKVKKRNLKRKKKMNLKQKIRTRKRKI